MVCSLSTYMAKEVIPIYVSKVEEESKTAFLAQARVSWLHLVDLMIKFDKQVQSLAAHSGIRLSLHEEGNMSSLVVFCDRPEWLHLWAEIVVRNALDKLNSELEDDMNWINQGARREEENKSPRIASVVYQHLSSVIARCRSLPSLSLIEVYIYQIGRYTYHTQVFEFPKV